MIARAMWAGVGLTRRLAFASGTAKKSFYRRELPEGLIALDSEEGKAIFREGMLEGNCESFFTWVQQFITQGDITTCSSASMAMMLNTLKIDPGNNWKGIWRWYDDYNIKHINTQQIKEGLTLQEFNQLAKFNSARSMAFSPLQGPGEHHELNQSSLSLFRSCVQACSLQNNTLLTVNFNRKTLGQTGSGHYSPVAAFNANRDMALVLDVAKFKYDSYWCSMSTLYEAFLPLDSASNQSRGFIMNSRRPIEEQGEDFHARRMKAKIEAIGQVDMQVHFDQVVKLVNDPSLHAIIVTMLFDYSTCQLDRINQSIGLAVGPRGIHDEQISLLRSRISQQGCTLLQAFGREGVGKLLNLLCFLCMVRSPLNQQLESLRESGQVLTGFSEVLRWLHLSFPPESSPFSSSTLTP